MASFFFSYASENEKNADVRLRGVQHNWMQWFHNRLMQNLQDVHPEAIEQSVYAPRIQWGANWEQALIQGGNSSRVIVCLQSPAYFRSRECGREVEIFLQRRKAYVKAGLGEPPPCIFPVWWIPLPKDVSMPAAMPSYFQAKMPFENRPGFKEYGVWEAIRRDDPETVVELYALELAQQISEVIRNGRPLPEWQTPEWDQIPSAFDEPDLAVIRDLNVEGGRGPKTVTIAYPANIPSNQLPWEPPHPLNAVRRAATVAKSREWIFQGVKFGGPEQFLEKIQTAREWKSPVVVMATEEILHDRKLCRQLSKLQHAGIARIVLSKAGGGEFPDGFQEDWRPHWTFTRHEEFEADFRRIVGELQSALKSEPSSVTRGSIPAF